jgi:transcriptional antiterminator NusG
VSKGAIACPFGELIPGDAVQEFGVIYVCALSSAASVVQPTCRPDRFPWFAVRVKSNFEKRVALSLSSKGLDTFLPQYTTERRWSDRFKTIDCALFPGYVFCRIDLNHRLPVLSTPGFFCIVSSGSKPTPVEEAEIARIQAVVRSGLSALPWPTLTVGQKVRLVRGPLRGLEAALLEVGKHKRIYVGVTLLRRGVSVEVDSDWIVPIGPPSAATDSHPRLAVYAMAQRRNAVPN